MHVKIYRGRCKRQSVINFVYISSNFDLVFQKSRIILKEIKIISNKIKRISKNMRFTCHIDSCRFSADTRRGFYTLPKPENRRKLWCESLKLESFPNDQTIFICYKHFPSNELHFTSKRTSIGNGKFYFSCKYDVRSGIDATKSESVNLTEKF